MPLVRLSVILAADAGPALAERAIRSVFNQADPIGIEVIVISPPDEPDHANLETAFARQVSNETLRFARAEAGPAFLLNEGARVARGNFLTFLDTQDQWLYGRLIELWPILEASDLILSPSPGHVPPEEGFRHSLQGHPGPLSSAVVRKSLFEAAGGFPQGDAQSGSELWLRCLRLLESSGRQKRFVALPSHTIKFGAML